MNVVYNFFQVNKRVAEIDSHGGKQRTNSSHNSIQDGKLLSVTQVFVFVFIFCSELRKKAKALIYIYI